MDNRHVYRKGMQIEQLAVDLVTNAGMHILHRNFCCKYGEIDIVASNKDVVAFIEVRYRKHNIFGNAAESVDRRKIQRIVRTAECYIQKHTANDFLYRFDVVAVSGSIKTPQMQWIKDAFDAY